MSVPAKPHDALFRALLDDQHRAAALLRDYLPAQIAAQLSEDPPVPVEGTFIDEQLRATQSDRLFEVRLRSGRPALIYALLEHKSTIDGGTPLQLLGYMVRIWNVHGKKGKGALLRLPPIIPLVFYHGQPEWTVPRSVLDCIEMDEELEPFVRSLRYELHDLGSIDFDALSRDDSVRAVLAALTCWLFEDELAERLRAIFALLPDGSQLETQVLGYIVSTVEMTVPVLTEALRGARPDRWEAMMSTVAEEWIQHGEARGKQLGLTEGKRLGLTEGKRLGLTEGKQLGLMEGEARGKAALLLRLIERRFGPVPETVRARISAADSADLDAWADAAIDAASLDDIFGANGTH